MISIKVKFREFAYRLKLVVLMGVVAQIFSFVVRLQPRPHQ